MKKYRKTLILNILGIIGVVGGTAAFVLVGLTSGWAFILAAIACIPMARNLHDPWLYWRTDTIRILRKALPKIEFTIEETVWNDQHTALRFYGKHRGDNFMIEAEPGNAYILIWDMPWMSVKASSPHIPILMEALNEVNAWVSNISVVLGSPEEDGTRNIYTLCRTILPISRAEYYLDALMCDILNRKQALEASSKRERPYMTRRHSPVGFNAPAPADDTNDQMEPAAKNETDVTN